MKFSGFQDLYFADKLQADFHIQAEDNLINVPIYLHPNTLDKVPAPGKPLMDNDLKVFVQTMAEAIANDLDLSKK
jgi:hypothetical protein